MKKMLLILSLAAMAVTMHAQERPSPYITNSPSCYVKPTYNIGDTLVSVDTLSITQLNIGDGLASVTAYAYYVSGTLAGKAYLQGSNNAGRDWTNIDSLTYSNTVSKKDFIISGRFPYSSMQMHFVNATGVGTAFMAYTRRNW